MSFQPPKRRQRISPLAHHRRQQRSFQHVPSLVLKQKVPVEVTQLQHVQPTIKHAEISTHPFLFKRPPRFSPTTVLKNAHVSPQPVTLKPDAPSTSSDYYQRLVERRRLARVELRVYESRTTFFTLPRELRQTILLQTIDFTELHECAEQYRDQVNSSHKGFCCHKKYLDEGLRAWKSYLDVRDPKYIDWHPWRDEVGFVWDQWFKESGKMQILAHGKK